MKTCCKCKTEKPVTEFHKNKSNKDGLQFKCKVCRKEAAAIWHLLHKNVSAARAVSYNSKNAAKVAKRQKAWYLKNRERCLQASRDYRKINKAKGSAYATAWAAANPERKREINRRSKKVQAVVRKNDPLLYAAYRDWHKNNYKKNCESLSDRYIKDLIFRTGGIQANSITYELIEAKRLHIQLVRKLKELKA